MPKPGVGIRGGDIDANGVAWGSESSGHLVSFDRSLCKGPLNGPQATGNHCPEGWKFYKYPRPGFEDRSVEASYYTWVDQHNTVGLGENVPISTANLNGGFVALKNGKMVMGANNRLNGALAENSGGRAVMEVFGERLTGMSRAKTAAGAKATGIIRIERVRCASSPGPNRLKMQLKAPMYLGERWELVFARENLTVRAYAVAPLEPGEHYVEFPPDALWVF